MMRPGPGTGFRPSVFYHSVLIQEVNPVKVYLIARGMVHAGLRTRYTEPGHCLPTHAHRKDTLFRHLKACKYPEIQARETDQTLKTGPSATHRGARMG